MLTCGKASAMASSSWWADGRRRYPACTCVAMQHEGHSAVACLKHYKGTGLPRETAVAVEAGKHMRQLSAAGCGAECACQYVPCLNSLSSMHGFRAARVNPIVDTAWQRELDTQDAYSLVPHEHDSYRLAADFDAVYADEQCKQRARAAAAAEKARRGGSGLRPNPKPSPKPVGPMMRALQSLTMKTLLRLWWPTLAQQFVWAGVETGARWVWMGGMGSGWKVGKERLCGHVLRRAPGGNGVVVWAGVWAGTRWVWMGGVSSGPKVDLD